MATATLKLGPADHGRIVPFEVFEHAPWEEGYRYELIDGRLYVSPVPEAPHEVVTKWAARTLDDYSEDHPETIDFVSGAARVHVPNQPRRHSVQPDIAAYQGFPRELILRRRVNWR